MTSLQPVGETVQASVDTTGLSIGSYQATVTVEAEAGILGSPAQIPVTLIVADQVYQVYLPLTIKE